MQYKPFVCSEAEVIEVQLDGTEEYLVLACDGLWDTVSPEELPRIVYNYLSDSGSSASGIAKYLVEYAKEHDSMDNISVIVIVFRDNLTEPVADAGFFSFLSGGEGDNSQGSDNSGTNSGYSGNSGAGNQNSSGAGGGDSGADNQDSEQGKDNRGLNDSIDGCLETSAEDKRRQGDVDADGEVNPENNEFVANQQRGLMEMQRSKPEMLIDINHMSFDIEAHRVRQEVSESLQTSTDAEDTTEGDVTDSERREEDLDYYGVFNTRLVDGPVDLSALDNANSSALLKHIADDVYNKTPQDYASVPKSTKNNLMLQELDKDTENSFCNFFSTEPYWVKKKGKHFKVDSQRSKKGGKGKSKSPVCWAFTGKNMASVQNYKLNMAAKWLNKGTSQIPGEQIPAVKPPPSKFAQTYSSTENVHDIANITLNRGKLESLPPPKPKVLPENLAQLSGIKVFGSKSYPKKETQKFHTTWRPRKPLKPISSIVYETPPTPFVNSKFQGMRHQ